jgi:coenzyme F420 hydrogenase subunit beta
MNIKTFEDLNSEIIEKNMCNNCGACVAVCHAMDINALVIENSRPKYVSTTEAHQECLECGLCYLICGQAPDLNHEIEALYAATYPIGTYKYLSIAKTTSPEIREKAQDGGVVTSIIKYLFDKHLIDGAVVNKDLGNCESIPYLISSTDDLINTAGTRYSNVPSVQELGKYRPILNKKNPRLAFVGCPCQVKTIRKMQLLSAKPGIYVRYLIGLFCMENYDYNKLYKQKLQNDLKIDLSNIKKVNIKGRFIITCKDGQEIIVPLHDLDGCIRNNCLYCTYYTNRYADISVGGAGVPEGYSVVLVRTKSGADLFTKLLFEKQIEELSGKEIHIAKKAALEKLIKLKEFKFHKGSERIKELLNI